MKRSLSIRGHRTSVSVEDAFWTELVAIAGRGGRSLASLVAELDAKRETGVNLSSAIRLFVLDDLLARLSADGSERLAADA